MIDSLDAKITQYVYAIIKLQHLIRLLRRIQARDNKKDLPLVQYIALLGGNLFAIADLVLAPRLDHIYNYRLYHQNPLTISLAASHIPYDAPDIPVTLLANLPDPERADKCLRLFEGMCIGCLQGYQKKLHQAKLERMVSFDLGKKTTQLLVPPVENGTPESSDLPSTLPTVTDSDLPESPPISLAEHISNIEKVVEYYFNVKDVDCAVSNQHFTLNLPLNQTLLHNEDFIEATLIDMDLRTLTYLNIQFQDTLERLRVQSHPFVGKSKTLALNYYTLHHTLALSLRLNDLYTVFRRTGRKCYFLNSEHLYDQKLFQQLRGQATQYKMGLQNADSFFSASKKNGTLIATLTRFFRQDARYESNVKSVNDLSTFIAQGLLTMKGLSQNLGSFLEIWLITELRFRRNYGLPKKILTDLYNLLHVVDGSSEGNLEGGTTISTRNRVSKTDNDKNGTSNIEIDKRQTIDLKDGVKNGTNNNHNVKINGNVDSTEKEEDQVSSQKSNRKDDDTFSLDLEPFSTPEGEKTITLNALDINSLSPPSSKSPSRSSSINSNSNSGRAKLNRRISPLASPAGTIKIPSSGSPSVSRSNSRRNSLIFSLSNLLLTSLPTLNVESKEPEIGRRRSNSQPIKMSDAMLALSGASSAARSLRLPSGSLRLPSGSIRLPSGSLRLPSGSIKMTLLLRPSSAPKPLNNVQKQLLSVQEEHQKEIRELSKSPESIETKTEEPTKLSANQRFQQHIKNASMQGFLTTQHREEMTSVVYDPNVPRSVNLRPKQKQETTRQKSFTSIGDSQLPAAGVSSDFSKLGNGLSVSGLGGGSNITQSQSLGSPTNVATRPTRAQVTKLNTRRNSVSIAQDIRVLNASLTDETSLLSDSTSGSGQSKKVRFTGVPEWTEAEDKPASYSTRILKNFAVFKTPILTYKKKDQMIKQDKMLQEESLSFRHLNGAEGLEQPDQVLVAEMGSPASGKVRRLKKLL